MMPRIEAGQFVRFTYNAPAKPMPPRRLGDPPPPAIDKSKEAFILHPNWHNKVQALDIKRITPAEQQVLHSIMDPKVKAAVDQGQWPVEGVPNYPLIRDILRRMDPKELIKNPVAFYQRFVKPFIMNKDCYRQYWPQYMYGLQVVQESQVVGKVTNPKPLFKKI